MYLFDSTGFIDKEELERVYRSFFAGLSDAEVKERAAAFIKLADHSADHRISYNGNLLCRITRIHGANPSGHHSIDRFHSLIFFA